LDNLRKVFICCRKFSMLLYLVIRQFVLAQKPKASEQ
jgi:hypothetical protein